MAHPASTPLADGMSPLLKLPIYIVDRIFQSFTEDGTVIDLDFKTKMKLELVCGTFASRIKKRACWSSENKLTIRGGPYNGGMAAGDDIISINWTQHSGDRIGRALSVLLQRITVREIRVENAIRLKPVHVLALCDAITEHSKSFSLKRIIFEELEGSFPKNVKHISTALGSCDLADVRIAVLDYRSDWYPKNNYFWPIVDKCANLRYLRFNAHTISMIDLRNSTINCGNLKTLKIGSFDELFHQIQEDMEHLAALVTLCNALESLTSLFLEVHIGDPRHFAQLLTEECRSRITELAFYTDDELHINDRPEYVEFAENAYTLFPNLKFLNLHAAQWDYRHVVTIVSNVITHFNSQNDDPHTLQLFIRIKEENAVNFFISLTDGLNAKLIIEKCEHDDIVYKCVKDNAVVEMRDLFCGPTCFV